MYIKRTHQGFEERAADFHLSIASFLQDFPAGDWQIHCAFSQPFQLDLFVLATDYKRRFEGQSGVLQRLVLAYRALAPKATPYM